MRLLERCQKVNIRTNYVLTYIRTGQTLYPFHNYVVRGDNKTNFNVYDLDLMIAARTMSTNYFQFLEVKGSILVYVRYKQILATDA